MSSSSSLESDSWLLVLNVNILGSAELVGLAGLTMTVLLGGKSSTL